jgi:hypothetical protein
LLPPAACSLQLRLRGDKKNIGVEEIQAHKREETKKQSSLVRRPGDMAECRAGGGGDGLIKLFGKTIPVPEAAAVVGDADKVCKPLPIFKDTSLRADLFFLIGLLGLVESFLFLSFFHQLGLLLV